MVPENSVRIELPETTRQDFMVLETADQKESLYHPLRLEILRALDQGYEDYVTESKRTERALEDGTLISEEVTIRKPSTRYWLSVHEILAIIKENRPKLEISNYNCYYHLRKLRDQGLVDQYPPPKEDDKGTSKRVRGMYFRTTARFYVPTTFEISPDLAERDVLPPDVTEKAVEMAQEVKETGRADAFEYQLTINEATYWFSVTMSLHDDGESIVSVVRDITEQKSTLEALRQSQERLDLALKGADLAPWDWHHKTGRMTFSERYAKLLGYSLQELNEYAENWEALIHPDDLELVLAVWDDHLENKTPMYSSEHRMMTKSGDYVWVLDRGRVVDRDDDGNPVRSAGTLLDVTHEKLVLEALDRSEERYRRLVNESLQGISILVDGRFVFVNPAYARTVGRSMGELLKMSPDETWNMIYPEDREELIRRNDAVKSGVKKLPSHRFRYIRPNGDVRWVESYVNVVEHDGRNAMQTLEVDITEQIEGEAALRESEKRFRGIFEVSLYGILLFDSEGRIIQINQAAADILGISRETGFEEYLLEKDTNLPEWVLSDVQEGEVITFEVEYDIRGAGFNSTKTDPIHLSIIGSALQAAEDGTGFVYLAQIQDITERKKSEMMLRESEERFRTLVESSAFPIIIMRGNPLTIVYANRSTTELTGYTTEDLIAMGPKWVSDALHPRHVEGALQTMLDILDGKQVAPHSGYEDEYVHHDGSVVWYRSFPSRIIYEGKPALQVLLLDITKQKMLEGALKESDDRYLSLIKMSSDALLLLKESTATDCNRAFLRMLGCKRSEVIEKALWQLSPRRQPDKSSSKQRVLKIIDSILAGSTETARWQFKRCDGSTFDSELNMTRIILGDELMIQVLVRQIK
ncbi:MAG: PAS domain-containing protein [Promethearchaeota archaeon]